jgi:hypothetical protein
MKIYDLCDDEGCVFAFEVANFFLSRAMVVKVVRTVPGAVIVRSPKIFSWFREDEFCEFAVDGRVFVAFEHFGDNSRYWIGPKELPGVVSELAPVREAFAAR